MYQLCENMLCDDIGLATYWWPLIRRLDNKIIFPEMMNQAKRMMTPMWSAGSIHKRLLVPICANPMITDGAATILVLKSQLDYAENECKKVASLLNTFLPFTMSRFNPWDDAGRPTIDIPRQAGWYNSSPMWTDTFGDTGDPQIGETLFFDEADGAPITWFAITAQPTWGTVKLASVFYRTDEIVDDEFYLMTPHQYGPIIIPDDNFLYTEFDANLRTNFSVDERRIIEYAHCRYATREINYGVNHPGYLGAKVYEEPLRRLMRIETGEVFEINTLKLMAAHIAGSGLREIRQHVSTLYRIGQTLSLPNTRDRN